MAVADHGLPQVTPGDVAMDVPVAVCGEDNTRAGIVERFEGITDVAAKHGP